MIAGTAFAARAPNLRKSRSGNSGTVAELPAQQEKWRIPVV